MSYEPVNQVHVWVAKDNADSKTHLKLGRLAIKDRRIYFEYDSTFLECGLEVSPFKLPLKAGVLVCEDRVFEGLFGVFNDSLPDGWGRLLLDRQVRRHGIAPEHLTPLDRLTHVGEHGMGALVYKPDVSDHISHGEYINLDHLAQESMEAIEGEAEEVIAELLDLSGSSCGARPKVMVGVSQGDKRIIHGRCTLPVGYSHWMVKFASLNDLKDIGAVEYAYSLMARAAGVDVMPTALFPAKRGAGYFGVQRFDRQGESRLHVHTISGLLHADHRLPSLDYEMLMRATMALTRDVAQVHKMLRLAVFNILAHNRDDHSKNFSFLMSLTGTWTLAPAYDITFSGGPGGEHSTCIMGEGKNPGKEHIVKLAEKFSISSKDANRIISEIRDAISKWPAFADEAGVSKASKKMIANVIGQMYTHRE